MVNILHGKDNTYNLIYVYLIELVKIYKVIYSVKTQHILIINIINLATCFGSLNHLQANS